MSQVGSHAARTRDPATALTAHTRNYGVTGWTRGVLARPASAPGSGESAADEEAAGGVTHTLPGATGSGLRPCFAAGAQPDKEAWADGFAQVVVVTAAEEDFEAPEA